MILILLIIDTSGQKSHLVSKCFLAFSKFFSICSYRCFFGLIEFCGKLSQSVILFSFVNLAETNCP